MSILRYIPELPLLRRELIELANRRRTYVMRFFGAILILTFVVFTFSGVVSQIAAYAQRSPQNAGNPNRFLGMGGVIFHSIVPTLFHFIQILMPALICGSITLEKERNTLGTLFVTRLSPMTIVFEKLGSRLIPMFTILLLTFPMLAFVYSLGGVDTTLLVSSLWLLFCESLFYASIGLMCSSWFATTVTSFIWSYVLTGFLVMCSRFQWFFVLTPFDVWEYVFLGRPGYDQGWIGGLFESVLLEIRQQSNAGIGVMAPPARTLEVMLVVTASLPSMLAALFWLLLARMFLIRRAFVSSSSLLLKVFKVVDSFFTSLNDRTTGGIVLIRDHDSLPLFDPVAWRERAKKSLGKARYLFRILIVMEGPTLFICLGAATASYSSGYEALRGLLFLMWGIAAIILAVKASTMISSERTRETLDALLSTPLTAREIIQQKISGMRRLMIVLSIPILSIHATLLLMHIDPRTVFSNPAAYATGAMLLYCVMTIATTFTVMHLISWLSALLGMRSGTQSRSFLAATSVLAGWMILSLLLIRPGGPVYETILSRTYDLFRSSDEMTDFYSMQDIQEQSASLVSLVACVLRPDGSIQANEAILVAASVVKISEYDAFFAISRTLGMACVASLAVFGMHFFLTLLLRDLTLRLAPRLLKRQDEKAIMTTSASMPMSSMLIRSESVA